MFYAELPGNEKRSHPRIGGDGMRVVGEWRCDCLGIDLGERHDTAILQSPQPDKKLTGRGVDLRFIYVRNRSQPDRRLSRSVRFKSASRVLDRHSAIDGDHCSVEITRGGEHQR